MLTKLLSQLLFTIILKTSLFSQDLKVYINDDLILSNQTYGYYPNYVNIKISSNAIEHEIILGDYYFYESNGKKLLSKHKIDSSFFEIKSDVYPNSKLLIEIKKIRNLKTNVISDYDRFCIIKFADNVLHKENKYLDVIVNENANSFKRGIKNDSIKSIRVVKGSNDFADTVDIELARGNRQIAKYSILISEFEKEQGAKILKRGYPGDRFLFSFYDKKTKKPIKCTLPVN